MVQKWIEGRRSAGSLSGGYNVSMREQVLACTLRRGESVELIAAWPGPVQWLNEAAGRGREGEGQA